MLEITLQLGSQFLCAEIGHVKLGGLDTHYQGLHLLHGESGIDI